MNPLPIFLKLKGRPCLLVGAGNVALEKIVTLLPTGPRLRVVAPTVRSQIRALTREGAVELMERAFVDSDLDGQFMVIAATDVPAINAAVYRGCVARGILCNSVDDIPNCDFFFGAIVSRGPLQIAISTDGESPAVAQRLRREIDAQLSHDVEPWLESLGHLRREVLNVHQPGAARKMLLHQLAERQVCELSACPSRQLAHAHGGAHRGVVALVGAGPGDPDLLTVKAMRLIQGAEVVLHDDLVPQTILNLANRQAEIVNVGKRCGAKAITQDQINSLMMEHARADRSVVRLKSGDPHLFGRAAEELAALADADIPFVLVPGVTAASAAAAAIGCSLTERHSASSVIFSSGHHAEVPGDANLAKTEDTTRVVYMPGRDLTALAEEWLHEGLPPDLPCAVVSHAAQPEQSVAFSTLAELAKLPSASAPSIVLAGWAIHTRMVPAEGAAKADCTVA